jgi:hypothetical protein
MSYILLIYNDNVMQQMGDRSKAVGSSGLKYIAAPYESRSLPVRSVCKTPLSSVSALGMIRV